MIRLILFISFLILNSSLLIGQTYSLENCIRLAIENNQDIKIQRLNVESTRLQYKQAKNNLLPSLSVGSSINYNIGYSINPLDYSYTEQNSFSGSINLSSQITLFQGFQQLRAIEKAEIDHLSVNYQIQSIENNVRTQTINLYLQALLDNETLNVLNKQYLNSKQLLTKKKEAAENGLIARNAYKEQQLQLSIDEANISKQTFQVENSVNKLKIYLQIPLIQPFKLDTIGRYEIMESKESRNFDFKNWNSFPDVEYERMRLRSLTKQVEIQKGSLYPTITFGYTLGSNFINTKKTYDYQTVKNPIIGYVSDSTKSYVRSFSNQSVAVAENSVPVFTQLENNRQHQFQLNFQWQIFGKGAKKTNIKLAEVAKKQQEYRIKLTEQKIKDNYFQALTSLESAYRKYLTSIAVFQAQNERFDLAKEKFINNLIDYFEFSTYQTQLINAELEVSKSKLEWYFSRELLKLYN